MRKTILTALAVLCVGLQAAAQDSAEDVLERMRKKYDSITDAELRFTEKVRFPLGKVEQSVSGTLQIRKENRYRVELPDQTIVTDGETVWSYTPSTRQVLIDRFKGDTQALTPEKLLTGAPGGFQPALVGKGGGQVQLKLTPTDEQALVSSIRLWVDERDWMIRQAELVDVNGKRTTYAVQQVKVNTGLPASRFTFQAPAGAEVVDLR